MCVCLGAEVPRCRRGEIGLSGVFMVSYAEQQHRYSEKMEMCFGKNQLKDGWQHYFLVYTTAIAVRTTAVVREGCGVNFLETLLLAGKKEYIRVYTTAVRYQTEYNAGLAAWVYDVMGVVTISYVR